MVVGDGRKYIVALIHIEMEAVGNWAQNRGISYATIKDLSHNPEVTELIRSKIAKVKEESAAVEQTKRFALIDRGLYHEEGDMTATQKTRRVAIRCKFIELIDALCSEHDSSGKCIDVSKPIVIKRLDSPWHERCNRPQVRQVAGDRGIRR